MYQRGLTRRATSEAESDSTNATSIGNVSSSADDVEANATVADESFSASSPLPLNGSIPSATASEVWDPAKDLDRAFREMMREKKPGEVAQIPSAAVLLSPYLPPFAVDLLAKVGSFAPPSFDIIAGFLLLFSLATRFYRLGFPNEVIFDEVHFGGFTNSYIKGVHFFDIHPPLTKLFFFFIARMVGYDGHYDYEKISNAYDDSAYYYLRSLPAFTGSFVPVFVYLTLREFGTNVFAATIGAIFLICDMCLLIESRIIVTDGVLLFFVAGAFYFHSVVRNCKPMTKEWYRWLFVCGIFIGGCISTKWTALGTMGIIGLDNLFILLNTWTGKSRKYLMNDWGWRFAFLFCVPACIYIYSWALHFQYLTHTGEGDAMVSPDLQKRFIGNQFENDTNIEAASLLTAIFKIQIKVYVHNKGITQPHGSMSTWWSWPFMVHGMGYWGTTLPKEHPNDPERRCVIYLLGNPFVWWSTTAVLFGYFFYLLYSPWRATKMPTTELSFIIRCMVIIGGHLLNWLPYIMVPRVTFLYHYLPSLIYAVILFCVVLDYLFPNLTDESPNARSRNAFQLSAKHTMYLYCAICSLAILFFLYFTPDTYAFPMTRAQREAKRWFESWH